MFIKKNFVIFIRYVPGLFLSRVLSMVFPWGNRLSQVFSPGLSIHCPRSLQARDAGFQGFVLVQTQLLAQTVAHVQSIVDVADPVFRFMHSCSMEAMVKQKPRSDCAARLKNTGLYRHSENRNSLAYVLQNGRKFIVMPGRLHIIVSLQAEPYRCSYSRRSLDF